MKVYISASDHKYSGKVWNWKSARAKTWPIVAQDPGNDIEALARIIAEKVQALHGDQCDLAHVHIDRTSGFVLIAPCM
ncbi:hypothetical protein RFM68_14170 [Mesorhizobium sp. MSK_1335]|uniref:Uncharacterized protein n=1 Tax=Mesorhizobium montanum TaxID=3072323 RepID=A0ABU4ZNR3_9HYPH|nr:hypothetical protein [Mesorhizobium sp. MSK_1335]MDX8525658.1 hypothetical protein [Mesorhizobium sp. MSK_1335]